MLQKASDELEVFHIQNSAVHVLRELQIHLQELHGLLGLQDWLRMLEKVVVEPEVLRMLQELQKPLVEVAVLQTVLQTLQNSVQELLGLQNWLRVLDFHDIRPDSVQVPGIESAEKLEFAEPLGLAAEQSEPPEPAELLHTLGFLDFDIPEDSEGSSDEVPGDSESLLADSEVLHEHSEPEHVDDVVGEGAEP